MRAAVFLVLFGALAAACGGSAAAPRSDGGAGEDAPAPDAATPADAPRQADAPAPADAPVPDDAGAPTDGPSQHDSGTAADGGTYRNSLSVCWTDATCPRVMAMAHGGAWDAVNAPYDSNAALINAYNIGIDAVKIDVRVTADNVPVIAHSSPIQIYESLICGIQGLVVEDSTAAQVTACLRAPSTTEHFQRLDDVLNYLRGKMVVQLCVKRSVDYQRTIQEIHAQGAEDFAFIELGSPSEMQTIVPTLTDAADIWFLPNLATDTSAVDTLIDVVHDPRAFMYEFDPTVNVSTLTPNRLHPAGVRSFTYDSTTPLSVSAIQGYYNGGYDVVSTQSAANAVQARIAVNTARGVSPP